MFSDKLESGGLARNIRIALHLSPLHFTVYKKLDTTVIHLTRIINELRKNNRLVRVLCSPHVHDLHTIAFTATSLLFIIIWVWGHVLFGLRHTTYLDNVLDNFYKNVACLEMYTSSDLEPGMKSLRKSQSELAKARGKLQHINGYLWTHISDPTDHFQTQIDALGSAAKELSTNISTPVPDRSASSPSTCQGWPSPSLSKEQSEKISLQIPQVTSSARRLASTLADSDSNFSMWAVAGIFGTVLLTFYSWLYRTGDSRMTIVDVIACEISSLCRAITNNRSVRSLSNILESKNPPYSLRYLEFQEVYNDFMHSAGQNLGFLNQSCIARITGFHTSLKILRDHSRMLKSWAIDASSEKPSIASMEPKFVKDTLEQIMYDFLLCLENARIALHLLLKGDRLHDDSIFVCLMSEIRAVIFLKNKKDNVTYINKRLEERLGPPKFGSLEELESYLHPVYAGAVCKMCDEYTKFYGDSVGIEIINKLRADVERSLSRAASATDTGPADNTPSLNTGLEPEPSPQA